MDARNESLGHMAHVSMEKSCTRPSLRMHAPKAFQDCDSKNAATVDEDIETEDRN